MRMPWTAYSSLPGCGRRPDRPVADPRRDRPAADKPAVRPLARYFPRQDLVVYAEFDGLDAHREAWTETAAYRLLNETTTGAMLEQSIARILDMMLADDPGPGPGPRAGALGVHLLRSGFAVGINRAGGAGLPRSFGPGHPRRREGRPRAILDRFLRAGEGRVHVKQVEKPGAVRSSVLGDSPRQDPGMVGRRAMTWS